MLLADEFRFQSGALRFEIRVVVSVAVDFLEPANPRLTGNPPLPPSLQMATLIASVTLVDVIIRNLLKFPMFWADNGDSVFDSVVIHFGVIIL